MKINCQRIWISDLRHNQDISAAVFLHENNIEFMWTRLTIRLVVFVNCADIEQSE